LTGAVEIFSELRLTEFVLAVEPENASAKTPDLWWEIDGLVLN
jgi:hypothetical protein